MLLELFDVKGLILSYFFKFSLLLLQVVHHYFFLVLVLNLLVLELMCTDRLHLLLRLSLDLQEVLVLLPVLQ